MTHQPLSYNAAFSLYLLQRPPSSSMSMYCGPDEARSPSSGGGTPGLMPPGSHLSTDNISEAGKTVALAERGTRS